MHGTRRIAIALLMAAVAGVAGWVAWTGLGDRPPAGRIRLALLPFENVSGNEELNYLVRGLADESIAALVQVDPRHLSVVGRTSTRSSGSDDRSTSEIGRVLDADYLLEGSVRAEADRLRLTVQLIRVRGMVGEWAASFDRERGGLLGLERELARAVAEQVRLKLSPERAATVARRLTRTTRWRGQRSPTRTRPCPSTATSRRSRLGGRPIEPRSERPESGPIWRRRRWRSVASVSSIGTGRRRSRRCGEHSPSIRISRKRTGRWATFSLRPGARTKLSRRWRRPVDSTRSRRSTTRCRPRSPFRRVISRVPSRMRGRRWSSRPSSGSGPCRRGRPSSSSASRTGRGEQVRDVHLVFLPVDPKWDPLRADPRFQALLDRTGLRGGERVIE